MSGQSYTFCLRNNKGLPQSLMPEKFRSEFLTLEFVRRFSISAVQWQHLITSGCVGYNAWRNTHPWSGIEEYVALCLIKADILVFKSKSVDNLDQTRAIRRFENERGDQYQFIPVSSLIANRTGQFEMISTPTQAIAFIQNINSSPQQLIELTQALDLTIPAAETNEKVLLDILSHALSTGDVVVMVEKKRGKPAAEEVFYEPVNKSSDSFDTPPPKDVFTPKVIDNKSVLWIVKAQAESLVNATEEGSPFCEACENFQDKEVA